MRRAKLVVIGLAVLVAALALALTQRHSRHGGQAAPRSPVTTVAPVTTITTVTTEATTTTVTAAAPAAAPPPAAGVASGARASGACIPDPLPPIPPTTDVASPMTPGAAYSNDPGGPTVGHLPASSWGGPTVRPVVNQQAGWVQVRLDRRPNGSTGWVRQQDVAIAPSAYTIVISTCRRNLTLFQQGQPIFSAPIGVGRPGTPTPLGPSFVDAILATSRQELGVYGPTIVVTGSHSNVYTEFGGSDGTVAIHAYPSDPGSTAGVASSHGCIRVNPQTINAIKLVPLGSPIDIIT